MIAAIDSLPAEHLLGRDPGLLGKLLDLLPNGVLVLDAKGRIVYANLRAQHIMGRTRSQMLGRTPAETVGETIHADGTPFPADEHPSMRTIRTGQPLSGVLLGMRKPDGALVWIEIDSNVVARDEDGSVSAVMTAFVDVTDRRAAESEAVDAGQNLIRVLESVDDGFYVLDREWRFTYVNPRAEEWLRHKSADLLGRSVWEAFPETVESPYFEACHRAVQTGTPTTVSIYYAPFATWYEARIHPSADGVSVYFQDVTERYRMAAALSEREAQYRALVEQVPAIIYTEQCDNGETLTYMSPYAESLLGFAPDAFLADRRLWTRRIHPDDRARVRALADQARERGERFRAEYRMIAADGRLVWVDESAELITDDDGRALWRQGVVYDVTAQREAQAALRERQERLLLALAASGMETWDWDPQTMEVTWPESLEEMIGEAPPTGRQTYEDFLASVHPDDRADVEERVRRALEGGGDYDPEYRKIRPDGTVRWQLSRGRVEHDAEGKPVRMRGVVLDITVRKEVEAALQASEERLRLALEAAQIGAWDWHVDSDVIVWSPSLSALLGLPAEERTTTVGEYRAAFVHPEDRSRAEATGRQSMGQDEFTEFEYRVVRADGEVRWLVDIGRAVERDAEGMPIRSAGVTMDITALKAATAALKLRDRALRAASSGILITDPTQPNNPIVDVNPAFTRITGYSKEEVVGRSAEMLVGPDTDRAAKAELMAAIAQGSEATATLQNYRKDGTPFWNELHLAPVRDANGRLTNFVGILNDVTERRWAEHELRFQSELLDQATVSVIALDPHGVVTHWNRHAERLYGWTREEAIGRPANELLIAPTDDKVSAEIRDRLQAGQPWEGDLVRRRKDGTETPVHVVDSPIHDPDGQLVGLVSVSVDISERRAFEERLAHQASHDALTGLPNRAQFGECLAHALSDARARRAPVGVLFLDLDEFKVVNDTLGHAFGDELLVAVGRRLSSALGPGALLARFGGDEFMVLLPDAPTERAAADVAARLIERLDAPFRLKGRTAHVRASIGIALSSASLDRSADLVRAADIALYAAKAAGRATYRVFEPRMAEQVASRMDLESDLRRAVGAGELRLYYQPEVCLKTGAIVGAEALVRWEHPRRGLLGPGEFIAVAEESDVILSIGEWVLNEACRQASAWQSAGPLGKRLTMSVNLAARQLRHPGLIDQITRALDRAGLSPHRLKLELTERAVVGDAEGESDVLGALRRLGVKLAIDDFGTGYSSLGYLRRWPLDTLKIDRSFVAEAERDPASRELVGAMARLARAVKMDVTAEGIERADQLAWLRKLGVERGQGYFFAPPAPAEEFDRLLAQHRRYPVSGAALKAGAAG